MNGYKYLAIFQLVALVLYFIFGTKGALDYRFMLIIFAVIDYIVYNEYKLKNLEKEIKRLKGEIS